VLILGFENLLFDRAPVAYMGGGLACFITCGTGAGKTDIVTHCPLGSAPPELIRAIQTAFLAIADVQGARSLRRTAAKLFDLRA
jgi:hypothetical protein